MLIWKASFDNRWHAVLTFSEGKKNPSVVTQLFIGFGTMSETDRETLLLLVV